MKILLPDENDRVLEVPDWTKTLVVDMDDNFVALNTDYWNTNMYDPNYMSRGSSRKRRFKTKVSFQKVES